MPRIVSTIASATEMIHALGLGAFQVARSHECDFPQQVHTLPVCTQPTFPVTGSSSEIDQQVKTKLHQALSIYNVDAKLLASLQPSHIVTQTQCKVCAVSLEDVERALQSDLGTDSRVISLEPNALNDIWRDIRNIASGCGIVADGEALIASLQSRMNNMVKMARWAANRPRVAAIEWLEPLMAAGNWVPELIEMAGGVNLFGEAGKHSPWMNWDSLVAADPDVIIALPCGFDLARTEQEMYWLTGRPGWKNLRAVQAGQVYLCDGNQYLNRPGPRIVESLQILAEILHPDLFSPQLETTGWIKYEAKSSAQ